MLGSLSPRRSRACFSMTFARTAVPGRLDAIHRAKLSLERGFGVVYAGRDLSIPTAKGDDTTFRVLRTAAPR
jgi:hypothetical protein